MKEKPTEPISLTFLDASSKEIRTFKSKMEPVAAVPGGEAAGKPASEETKDADEKESVAPAMAGLNRFVWDTRYPPATEVKGDSGTEDALNGPMVVPGTYQVRLKVGDTEQTVSFAIAKDPRIDVSQRDLQAQFDLLLAIRDKLSETNQAILNLRDLRTQAEGWEKRLGKPAAGEQSVSSALSTQHSALVEAAKALREKAKAIEDMLIQEKADSPLQLPIALNAKLATLAGFVDPADVAPSHQAQEVFADLSRRIDQQLRQLDDLMEADVSAFNRQVRDANISAILAKQA